MDDKVYQRKALQKIYDEASLAPVFKRNPKYGEGRFSGMVPYISYNDIMEFRYIIRARPTGISNPFFSEEMEIIASYDSIESLVNDGWRLD